MLHQTYMLSYFFSLHRTLQRTESQRTKMLMRFPNCRITLRVTLRKDIAAASALLLCLSPASVFLTYAYTESLFQLLTFTGVWLLLVFEPIAAALAFAGSCAVRSNGAHCNTATP